MTLQAIARRWHRGNPSDHPLDDVQAFIQHIVGNGQANSFSEREWVDTLRGEFGLDDASMTDAIQGLAEWM